MNEEVSHRISFREARKAVSALMSLWKKRPVCRNANVGLFEGLVE